jgi:hypothetical protein
MQHLGSIIRVILTDFIEEYRATFQGTHYVVIYICGKYQIEFSNDDEYRNSIPRRRITVMPLIYPFNSGSIFALREPGVLKSLDQFPKCVVCN